jgi:DNA-binding response OmpR family regulator
MTTLVMADDDPGQRALVRATITADEYTLLEAADGNAAWALIQEHQPALALLDVDMPGRTGLELARAIKSDPRLASAYVILLTGRADETDMAAGRAAGADRYLTKPFSPLELLHAIEDALAHAPVGAPASRSDPAQRGAAGQQLAYAQDLRQLYEDERARRRELEDANRALAAANAELDRRIYDLLAAQDWILAVNSSRDLPALMDLLAQPLVLLLQARTTLVFPWDPTTKALGSVLGYGLPTESPWLAALRTSALSATAWSAGRLLETPDLDAEPTAGALDSRPARALGWRALAVMPLVARGERVGLLYVGWDKPHELDDRERTLLALLAQHAALGLANARLIAEQRHG